MGDDEIENVIGSGHDDVLTGNRAPNSLWGLGGNDELDGGRSIDMLFGGAGDDDLDGGDGNDTLEGGYGADVLTGGDGSDTASYAGSMMGVTVRLHNSKAMGGDAEGDTFGGTVTAEYMNEDGDEFEEMLPDIINLTGSANADVLAGDFRNNEISGKGGDDKIYGGPGGGVDSANADTLSGGGGNDMIFGGAGDDALDGGDGNDMLVGGAGADTYDGGAGDDMIIADAMDLTIDGGEGTDTLSYAALEETPGPRTLGGTADTPTVTISNVENIIGSQDDDILNGEANMANVIEGGEGGDDMDGGADGGDTLSYAGSDDWVRVTLGVDAAAEAITSRGHASGDSATNFENITGSAYDDDLTGNAEANVLMGGAGDDELTGHGGADTIEGGAGADELDGGEARSNDNEVGDTLSYAGSDAGVHVNLATARLAGGHADGDTITTVETDHDDDEDATPPVPVEDQTDKIEVSTFENVTGSMHNDTLTGDYRFNVLKGGGGDDTLRGGSGADHLIGGAGADMLDGGSSLEMEDDPDTADVDETAQDIDWAVYRGAMEGVMVDLSTGMGTGGEAMGDTLVNIELVWGSMHDDTFIASNGADYIHGDNGSDTVSYEASELGVTVNLTTDQQTQTPFDGETPLVDNLGGAIATIPANADDDENPNTNGAAGDRLGGIENLTGSAQADELTGNGEANTLMGGGGNDTLMGGEGDDMLMGGEGDDTLSATGGANTLMGGDGDDTLTGGTGDDTINGGAGDDQMNGGGGTDTFVFGPADGDGDDVITGFVVGTDRINLSAYDLTAAQVAANIDLFGGNVRIDLTSFGGGKIILDNVTNVDAFDESIEDGETADGVVQELNVFDGTNTDGVFIIA